jgi:hypothetical protein
MYSHILKICHHRANLIWYSSARHCAIDYEERRDEVIITRNGPLCVSKNRPSAVQMAASMMRQMAGPRRRRTADLHTPVGGENMHNFVVGDMCWFVGAVGDEDEEDTDVVPPASDARTMAELLGVGPKPTIRIDEPATQSLCTQWSRLEPLICRGERCWYVVERGIGRGGVRKSRRVLAELQQARPGPSIRTINCEESRTVSWSDLEQLSTADVESLQQLEPISEAKLAQVLAAAAGKGCTLGEVRWKRQRNGELWGEHKTDDGRRRCGCPKKVMRTGKKCGTPGCTFLDLHSGICSVDLDLPPRRRTPLLEADAPSSKSSVSTRRQGTARSRKQAR